MSLTSRSVKAPSVKRVSFQETVQQTFKEAKKDQGSSVEISELFPKLELKSILRESKSKALRAATMSPMSDEARTFLTKRRRRKAYVKTHYLKAKPMPQSFLPPKEPTETLAHAMLRSMSHKVPPKKSKLILPKIALVTEADKKIGTDSPRTPSTLRSYRSLQHLPVLTPRDHSTQTSFDSILQMPEIITNSAQTNVMNFDRVCGMCVRNWRKNLQPAAGFCKFCDEFLCANCVNNHRGRLTHLHPVVIFYCDTCKEMNVLNRKGSGYCVKCKHFYCSVCVVLHCMMKNHEVLEGKDLLDVTDVMIGK